MPSALGLVLFGKGSKWKLSIRVKILNFKFSGDADVLLMSQDSEDEIRSRFVFELVI